MEHYVDTIGRTLNEVASSEKTPASATVEGDVASFSGRLQDVVRHLHAFDNAKRSKKAHDCKRVVRELKLVAGRLTAQAEELKNSKGPSRGAWVKPAIAKVASGALASWALWKQFQRSQSIKSWKTTRQHEL
jgi:hypothetical protein